MAEAAIREGFDAYLLELIDRYTYCDCDYDKCTATYEIYADYNDTIQKESVIRWCEAANPGDAFYEELFEWYNDFCGFDCPEEILRVIKPHWDTEKYELDEESVMEWLHEHICYQLPVDHYLDQTVCVDLIVDTGDGNYDFVLNDIFPHYDGVYGEVISEKASVLWLARQQGYKKRELNKALYHRETNGSAFMESLHTELANCSTHMNCLTFFVKMKVRELLRLNEALHGERKGKLTISKEVPCGLYDPWNGAGSVLDIQLEKDVLLPLKFIDSALPDGGRGYSVASAYGICESLWKNGVKSCA